MLNALFDMVEVWAGLGGGEGVRGCGGRRWYRCSHWLYDNPHVSTTRTSCMYPMRASCTQVAGTLASDVLEVDRAGDLGGLGFGCTSQASAINRDSGSKSGPVVSGSVE